MKSFYSFLKETSSKDTISELCRLFLDKIKKKSPYDDRFLPMNILADYIEENFKNSYKADQIRNFVNLDNIANLGMAANKYLETGFFTFNDVYNDTIHPMLLTFNSGYPYYMVTYKIDDRGLQVDMASLGYVQQQIVNDAKSRQMGINQYIKEVYDSNHDIETLVNFENSNLEFYWHERRRSIVNIVQSDNTIKRGKDEINEEMNEKFLTERLPEAVGEEVARGRYHIINDLEYYHVG
jgi:hypothetical protein